MYGKRRLRGVWGLGLTEHKRNHFMLQETTLQSPKLIPWDGSERINCAQAAFIQMTNGFVKNHTVRLDEGY